MAWILVTDQENQRVSAELLSGAPGGQQMLRLENGRKLLVPEDMLVKQSDDDYRFRGRWREVEAGEARLLETETQVVPLVEETLRVSKRRVERGGVRVHKRVREHYEVVDEPLIQEQVEVERVSVGRLVDEPVPIRYEGDTAIISLLEEVLVVEKRLMLSEEVHVTKRRVERREPQRIALRREEATIEHLEDSHSGAMGTDKKGEDM